MTTPFTPETVDWVLNKRERCLGKESTADLGRTALHVDFSHGPYFAPAEPLSYNQIGDPALFNAVGSRTEHKGLHLPILDIDGGVMVEDTDGLQIATLWAAHPGVFLLWSRLRPLLLDHGIGLEVRYEHMLPEHQPSDPSTRLRWVAGFVLSSTEKIFRAVPSTTPGHGHLYIDEAFSESDHTLFIEELRRAGIVSSDWADLTRTAGMGIVRTPWSEKDPDTQPS